MRIDSNRNSIGFKKLEYKNISKEQIEKLSPDVQNLLENASKEITKTKLVVLMPTPGLLHYYVDIGNVGLTYIFGAISEGKKLKIGGYTYDYKDNKGMRNTSEYWHEISFNHKQQAQKYARLINSHEDRFGKTIEVAKAMDAMA